MGRGGALKTPCFTTAPPFSLTPTASLFTGLQKTKTRLQRDEAVFATCMGYPLNPLGYLQAFLIVTLSVPAPFAQLAISPGFVHFPPSELASTSYARFDEIPSQPGFKDVSLLFAQELNTLANHQQGQECSYRDGYVYTNG